MDAQLAEELAGIREILSDISDKLGGRMNVRERMNALIETGLGFGLNRIQDLLECRDVRLPLDDDAWRDEAIERMRNEIWLQLDSEIRF